MYSYRDILRIVQFICHNCMWCRCFTPSEYLSCWSSTVQCIWGPIYRVFKARQVYHTGYIGYEPV